MNVIRYNFSQIDIVFVYDDIINSIMWRIKKSAHLVYWLLGERWYPWYWHVILIKEYAGGWENESQVHFVRRSHFDDDLCLQLLAVWLNPPATVFSVQCLTERSFFLRCFFALWKAQTFFTLLGWKSATVEISFQFYEYIFSDVELSGDWCNYCWCFFSRPSPTCFFPTKLCNILQSEFCVSGEEKCGTLVNYFVKINLIIDNWVITACVFLFQSIIIV